MVAFQDPCHAVSFAMDTQMKLLIAEWPPELLDDAELAGVGDDTGDGLWRGLRVRIGVHTGPCLHEIDPTHGRMDYFGNMVNFSARVEAQADGGEVVVSQATLDVVQPVIESSGLVVTPKGVVKLKGIKEPAALYRILPASLAAREFESKDEKTKQERQDSLVSAEEASVLANLAVGLHSQGRVEDAIGVYQQALENRPDEVSILFNLGLALMQINDMGGAVATFQKIVDLDPSDGQAMAHLGEAQHQNMQLAEAVATYRHALALPQDPEIQFVLLASLGDALENQNDLSEAVKAFEGALEIRGDTEIIAKVKRLKASQLRGSNSSADGVTSDVSGAGLLGINLDNPFSSGSVVVGPDPPPPYDPAFGGGGFQDPLDAHFADDPATMASGEAATPVVSVEVMGDGEGNAYGGYGGYGGYGDYSEATAHDPDGGFAGFGEGTDEYAAAEEEAKQRQKAWSRWAMCALMDLLSRSAFSSGSFIDIY